MYSFFLIESTQARFSLCATLWVCTQNGEYTAWIGLSAPVRFPIIAVAQSVDSGVHLPKSMTYIFKLFLKHSSQLLVHIHYHNRLITQNVVTYSPVFTYLTHILRLLLTITSVLSSSIIENT